MSKAVFGVLVFASIFVLIVLIVVVRFLLGLYRRIKNTKKAMEDVLYNHQRQDYTGRRAQQYHYDENGKQRRSTGPLNDAAQADAQPRRTKTESGEVIIDHRHQERENKKIFSDDDGEYVDFSES